MITDELFQIFNIVQKQDANCCYALQNFRFDDFEKNMKLVSPLN